MNTTTIGLLHPGEMGAALGATLVGAGRTVLWASAGRSPTTERRATAAGLTDVRTVGELVNRSDVVLSVCPPSAALGVAKACARFGGLYVDANAIAPSTAAAVAELVESFGARYVDGGIVGPPPSAERRTHLYLSGASAPAIRELFAGTQVNAAVLTGRPTAASALKMCNAAWTKGSAALLLSIRAAAVAEGIDEPLLAVWQEVLPALAAQSLKAAQQAATKGWRWSGEMEEVATTFAAAGLPEGFHRAAAEVYGRAPRDESAAADAAALSVVIEALLGGSGAESAGS